MFKKKINIKDQRGVTLIELMVAFTIFVVVIISTTQIFNMVVQSQRVSLMSQNVEFDMRYLTEVITKEIRMAQVDKEGNCVTENKVYSVDGDELKFVNHEGQCVTYRVNNEGKFEITRNSQTKVVTSQDTYIEDISFRQYGEVPASQPRLTMNLNIKLGEKSGPAERRMNFQTTISTRHYE